LFAFIALVICQSLNFPDGLGLKNLKLALILQEVVERAKANR
jgi:hypothetical protein